jgi:hypothetical protein
MTRCIGRLETFSTTEKLEHYSDMRKTFVLGPQALAAGQECNFSGKIGGRYDKILTDYLVDPNLKQSHKVTSMIFRYDRFPRLLADGIEPLEKTYKPRRSHTMNPIITSSIPRAHFLRRKWWISIGSTALTTHFESSEWVISLFSSIKGTQAFERSRVQKRAG